jgi:hypothetical protein
MSVMQSYPRITPFLWFDANAEQAVDFYLSVFKNSRRLNEVRNTASDDPRLGPKGGIITIAFELDSQKFTALNGGPMLKFNESVSFVAATRRPRSTSTGPSSPPMAARKANAAGSRTSSGSPGRSSPRAFPNSSAAPRR